MISISMRPMIGRKWGSISFASTLHLCPVLDLLLAQVPKCIQGDVRLGLQEALVNAATHGNQLDPSKTISVQFFFFDNQYWWIIADQGKGFSEFDEFSDKCRELPDEHLENGRGLYILHQIFDQVKWSTDGTELQLCKQVGHLNRLLQFR